MAAGRAAAALGVLVLWCCAARASAKDHSVGDSTGWTNGFDYSTWTSGKTFVAGDTLTFNYIAGVHTVDQVSSKDYSSCTASNALSTDSSGQTTVKLAKAGTYYFICGVASHCSGGMKVAVTVKKKQAASPALAPAPSSSAKKSPKAAAAPSSTDDDGATPSSTTPATSTSTSTTPAVKQSASAGIAISPALVMMVAGMMALKVVVVF